MATVVWLHHSLYMHQSFVGSKAMGLSRLCRLQANVPVGFVVPPTDCVDQALKTDITLAMQQLVQRFGMALRLAVRSSASAEDGVASSYAGMYQTRLNVPPPEVLDAIEACRNSFGSDRISSYRDAIGHTGEDIPIAVIVQRMLQPTFAGVCFTTNPITFDDEIVIEVVRGIGEALVSGQVTPDCYCLSKADGIMRTFDPGDENKTQLPLLSPWQLRKLWREARRLESAFGHPLDLEFAFVNERLYILQARPVTTTAPVVGQAQGSSAVVTVSEEVARHSTTAESAC
jgi:phosphoenolpyruvate synthase/pyruvate phosphate dikinase